MMQTEMLYGTSIYFDNSGTGNDPINDIFQTSDGGYIAGGFKNTKAHPPTSVAYIVKTNSAGDTLWTRYWGGQDSTFTDFYLVTQTSDGNILAGGYTTAFGVAGQNAFVIKLNVSTGDTLWTRVWGGSQHEWLYSMQETKDKGIILTGVTGFGAGSEDILLIKTDANGNIKWAKTYGDSANQFGFGHCLQQTTDGGFIITGSGGFLMKTDSVGAIKWQKTFNFSPPFQWACIGTNSRWRLYSRRVDRNYYSASLYDKNRQHGKYKMVKVLWRDFGREMFCR